MSTSFAITPTALAVALDAERRGEVSFNVTNVTSQTLRSRAEIRADSTAAAGWFELDQPADGMLMEPGSTIKLRVRMTAPTAAAAGRVTFRPLVYALEQPGELFAEGPTVAIEVPAAPPTEPKPFPWWMVGAAAAVVLALGFGAYYVATRESLPEIADSGSFGQVSLRDFRIGEGDGNVVVAGAGAPVRGSTAYEYNCPDCAAGSINQIILGIDGQDRAQACIYNGRIRGQGNADFTLTAPSEPGTYFVRFRYAQAFNCGDALGWWTVDGAPPESANIGAIVVRPNGST